MNSEWIQFYLGMAEYISTKSKDPNTKCGCVIVRPDKTVSSIGFNGFPSAVHDYDSRLMDRELKNTLMVHAEDNAFKNSRDSNFIGFSLFVHPFMPCPDCALDMVSNGISYVYTRPTPEDKKSRWQERFQVSKQILEMGKIILRVVDYE